MCLFEFDEEKAMQAERAEGTERTILKLVLKGLLDENVAVQELGITLEELREKLQRFKEDNTFI